MLAGVWYNDVNIFVTKTVNSISVEMLDMLISSLC